MHSHVMSDQRTFYFLGYVLFFCFSLNHLCVCFTSCSVLCTHRMHSFCFLLNGIHFKIGQRILWLIDVITELMLCFIINNFFLHTISIF